MQQNAQFLLIFPLQLFVRYSQDTINDPRPTKQLICFLLLFWLKWYFSRWNDTPLVAERYCEMPMYGFWGRVESTFFAIVPANCRAIVDAQERVFHVHSFIRTFIHSVVGLVRCHLLVAMKFPKFPFRSSGFSFLSQVISERILEHSHHFPSTSFHPTHKQNRTHQPRKWHRKIVRVWMENDIRVNVEWLNKFIYYSFHKYSSGFQNTPVKRGLLTLIDVPSCRWTTASNYFGFIGDSDWITFGFWIIFGSLNTEHVFKEEDRASALLMHSVNPIAVDSINKTHQKHFQFIHHDALIASLDNIWWWFVIPLAVPL